METRQLTQCVDGWQCGACGLSGVEREPPRINAVPPAPIWSGYAHGICSWARRRSNIGINSAKCSSAIGFCFWWSKKRDNGKEICFPLERHDDQLDFVCFSYSQTFFCSCFEPRGDTMNWLHLFTSKCNQHQQCNNDHLISNGYRSYLIQMNGSKAFYFNFLSNEWMTYDDNVKAARGDNCNDFAGTLVSFAGNLCRLMLIVKTTRQKKIT